MSCLMMMSRLRGLHRLASYRAHHYVQLVIVSFFIRKCLSVFGVGKHICLVVSTGVNRNPQDFMQALCMTKKGGEKAPAAASARFQQRTTSWSCPPTWPLPAVATRCSLGWTAMAVKRCLWARHPYTTAARSRQGRCQNTSSSSPAKHLSFGLWCMPWDCKHEFHVMQCNAMQCNAMP